MCSGVCGFQSCRVDAIGEDKKHFEIFRASLCREGGEVFGFSCVAVAPPLDSGEGAYVGLGFRLGVSGDDFEILGDGDLGAFDPFVIAGELCERYGRVC